MDDDKNFYDECHNSSYEQLNFDENFETLEHAWLRNIRDMTYEMFRHYETFDRINFRLMTFTSNIHENDGVADIEMDEGESTESIKENSSQEYAISNIEDYDADIESSDDGSVGSLKEIKLPLFRNAASRITDYDAGNESNGDSQSIIFMENGFSPNGLDFNSNFEVAVANLGPHCSTAVKPIEEKYPFSEARRILCGLLNVNSITDIPGRDGIAILENATDNEIFEILEKSGYSGIRKLEEKKRKVVDILIRAWNISKILATSPGDFRCCVSIAEKTDYDIQELWRLMKECEAARIVGQPNFANDLRALGHFIEHGRALGCASPKEYISLAQSRYGVGEKSVNVESNGTICETYMTETSKAAYYVGSQDIIIGTFHKIRKPRSQ